MLTMIIQAGGKSTRMGEDKALRAFRGRPLIEHLLDTFSLIGDELLIITNHPKDYQYLGVPLRTDIIPHRGSLGGLYTALSAASHPHVGLVACDMPFASPHLIQHLHHLLQKTGADAVLPSTDSGAEPMHAVYRRQTCLPLVKSAIEKNQWRMISWHNRADVRVLSPEETGEFAPLETTFWNLNTPEDFREAERLARELADQESNRSSTIGIKKERD